MRHVWLGLMALCMATAVAACGDDEDGGEQAVEAKCGEVTCPTNQYCCDASCGLCIENEVACNSTCGE